MNERILLRKDSCSSYSLVRARFPYIFCSPVFQSLSIPFFILVDATFALLHRSRWLLFSFFFSLSQSQCGGIFVLFYFRRPSSSFFLLVRRLRRSLSASFARHRFLYCIYSPVSSLLFRCSAAALGYLSQVFHARIYVYKRALSYFPRLPLFSRSSCHRARKRPRDPATWRFPFSFSYVRSVHDTWSVLSCLDIVLFCCAKCIPQGISPIFVPSSRCSRARSPLLSLFLRFPATSLLRRWAILENTIRSIPSHYPR